MSVTGSFLNCSVNYLETENELGNLQRIGGHLFSSIFITHFPQHKRVEENLHRCTKSLLACWNRVELMGCYGKWNITHLWNSRSDLSETTAQQSLSSCWHESSPFWWWSLSAPRVVASIPSFDIAQLLLRFTHPVFYNIFMICIYRIVYWFVFLLFICLLTS